MTDWTPVVVLPNLRLNEPVECGPLAVIAPASDNRVLELAKVDVNLGRFLSKFTDAFGRSVEPSMLLFREDAPKSFFSGEAVSGLRDAMSISAVPLNRARQLNQGAAQYFVWSNFFLIYPWTVAKDKSGLTAYTSAFAAFDDVKDFKGQSSPEIIIQPMDRSNFDRPMRVRLIEKWQERYSKSDPPHEEVALFRALNMAFSASAVPSGPEGTYYDVGRLIALWVSAFEVLAHPGKSGKVDLGVVYELLKKAHWHQNASKEEKHECYNNRGDAITSINGCWLYGLLYQARNNFLHGNPVTVQSLRLPSGRNLFEIAAPLFRMALTGFLPLTFNDDGEESYSDKIGKLIQFYGPQDTIEDALLGAHAPPDD